MIVVNCPFFGGGEHMRENQLYKKGEKKEMNKKRFYRNMNEYIVGKPWETSGCQGLYSITLL